MLGLDVKPTVHMCGYADIIKFHHPGGGEEDPLIASIVAGTGVAFTVFVGHN